MQDLELGLAKVKKVEQAVAAGIVTTPKVKELENVVTEKKVKENLNVCLKLERHH